MKSSKFLPPREAAGREGCGERCQDAAQCRWLRRSLDANRNYSVSHFELAAALARLGELDEVRATVQAGLALDPCFTIRRFRDATNAMIDNPTHLALRDRTIEGLRMAGVPEG